MADNDWFIEDLRKWMSEYSMPIEDLGVTKISYANGKKNPFYGMSHTEEWKENARKRMIGNKNTAGYKYKPEHVAKRAASRSRPVTIKGVTYKSGREAAKSLGVSPSTIVQWKKNGQ